MGLRGTFTRKGGWGRQWQLVGLDRPVENLEPREQENLIV